MKLFKILAVAVILATIISGCGAQPAVPTISPEDVQGTAVSAASTMVAQTQAAIPTATPLPPTATFTFTPAFTNTPVASPTPAISSTPLPPTADPNADPCDTRVLSWSPRGRETVIRIVNTTRQPITVSVYLHETDSHGECGYRAYNLARNNDVVITDLVQGCYSLAAFSTGNDPFNSSGYGCINNPDKWTFEVGEGSIKSVGP
jgi:hypothetical protein